MEPQTYRCSKHAPVRRDGAAGAVPKGDRYMRIYSWVFMYALQITTRSQMSAYADLCPYEALPVVCGGAGRQSSYCVNDGQGYMG